MALHLGKAKNITISRQSVFVLPLFHGLCIYIYIHMTICSLLLFFLPTFSREEQECTVPVASVESTGQAVCFVTSVHYALVCLNPVFGDQLRSPKV